MIEIRTGTFADLREFVWQIRHTVFVIEQNVPQELEADDRDSACLHVAAFLDGNPVASGRIDPETGKVGRVAVLKEYRQQGIGRTIMQAIEELAIVSGHAKVWFHAQESAIPFYEQLGYVGLGEIFFEADIPHRRMEKSLKE